MTFIFYIFNLKNLLSSFFLFSLLFGFAEFIRGNVLTGFPWNLIVYSLSKNLNLIYFLSVVGTYGFNLIVISLFSAPSIYILRKSKKEIIVCFFLLLLPVLLYSYGHINKQKFLNNEVKDNPYLIRAIGSNISLDRFYENTQTKEIINDLIKLSKPEMNEKTFFLWPEGIIPFTYQDDLLRYYDLFNENFDDNHLIGLGITSRYYKENEYEYFNSFIVIDNKSNLIENYNKVKLVPFGEFIPFESFLNKIGFKTITNNFGSYSKGENREIIEIRNNLGELKFLPLICYEIIYSGTLTKSFDFDFIFNISEDGWFGKSIGPKQHLAHSIFRAIETGKYIIRSANNGMAAIINPLGEIEQKVDYGQNGFIDFKKSKVLNSTIFSRFGNKIFTILILLYIFLIFSFNRFKNE